ncbi:MAG: hypothetical protein IKS90_01520 [Clostridia bacterium]|nr:hypothetical protein [Clostridia bacterium]
MKPNRLYAAFKRFFLLILGIFTLIFYGCSSEFITALNGSLNTPMLLPSESKAHFPILEQRLEKTVQSFDLKLQKVNEREDDDGIIVDFEIALEENARVCISLFNLLLDGKKKGVESFSVAYQKYGSETAFNTQLFAEIVNSVSRAVLLADDCDAFINDTDGSYSEISANGEPGWMNKFKQLDEYGKWSISQEWVEDESKLSDPNELDYTDLLYSEGQTRTASQGTAYRSGFLSCATLTPTQHVERCTGAKVSKAKLVSHSDSHGGFLGDGITFMVIDCSELDGGLEESMSAWRELPMSDELHLNLFGDTVVEKDGTSYDYNGLLLDYGIPDVRNGLYYFKNRNQDAKGEDDEDIYHAISYNFTFALYDSETRMLYYYELDT